MNVCNRNIVKFILCHSQNQRILIDLSNYIYILYNYVNQEFHLLISDHSKIKRASIFIQNGELFVTELRRLALSANRSLDTNLELVRFWYPAEKMYSCVQEMVSRNKRLAKFIRRDEIKDHIEREQSLLGTQWENVESQRF